MTGWLLRIERPVENDAMRDSEAISDAWFEVPGMAEEFQVTIAGQPRMQVVPPTREQYLGHQCARLVLCEVPVIRRVSASNRDAA